MSIATVLNNRFQKLKVKTLVKIKNSLKITEPVTEYYLAYGGNISIMRFKQIGFLIEKIATIRIENYRLIFAMPCEYKGIGYATIEPSSDSAVFAVLYKCQKSFLRYLDVTEWVKWGYYNRNKISINFGSREISAWVYISVMKDNKLKPSHSYLNWIIHSAKENNFPNEYIKLLTSTDSIAPEILDHEFNLTCPSKKRPVGLFSKGWIEAHDKLREWLCKKI